MNIKEAEQQQQQQQQHHHHDQQQQFCRFYKIGYLTP